jgi:predicted DNA-binding protein
MATPKTQTSIRFNTSTLNKLDAEADRLGITRTNMLDRIIHDHFNANLRELQGFGAAGRERTRKKVAENDAKISAYRSQTAVAMKDLRTRVKNLESAMALFVASGK